MFPRSQVISIVTSGRASEPSFYLGCCRGDSLSWQSVAGRKGECAMGPYDGLTPEERARITEIQDFLIDRYVEQKEAQERGDDARAKEIAREIKELQREKEEIKEWAAT